MKDAHPRIEFWLEVGGLLLEAGDAVAKAARKKLRPRRTASYATTRPGPATPMWNLIAHHLRAELRPYGAKVRLARYLDIPRQRLSDFLTGQQRLPDAELTLRMLHWLVEKRGGRDLSL